MRLNTTDTEDNLIYKASAEGYLTTADLSKMIIIINRLDAIITEKDREIAKLTRKVVE